MICRKKTKIIFSRLGTLGIAIFVSNFGNAATPLPDENFQLPGHVQKRAISLREKALENSNAYDIVESLTTEVGHRSAGSTGDKAAVSWALEKFKEMGFANIRAEQVTVPHWERTR